MKSIQIFLIIAILFNTTFQIGFDRRIEDLNDQITLLENKLDTSSKELEQCVNDK